MGMAETGVCWRLLPSEDRLWEQVKHWFNDRRIVYGYNIKDPLAQRSQYGGTAIVGVNSMVTKIQSSGRDPRDLGRWCWFRIQGKNHTTTRIVTAYCPCVSPQTHLVPRSMAWPHGPTPHVGHSQDSFSPKKSFGVSAP